jgi:hypothetical protein
MFISRRIAVCCVIVSSISVMSGIARTDEFTDWNSASLRDAIFTVPSSETALLDYLNTFPSDFYKISKNIQVEVQDSESVYRRVSGARLLSRLKRPWGDLKDEFAQVIYERYVDKSIRAEKLTKPVLIEREKYVENYIEAIFLDKVIANANNSFIFNRNSMDESVNKGDALKYSEERFDEFKLQFPLSEYVIRWQIFNAEAYFKAWIDSGFQEHFYNRSVSLYREVFDILEGSASQISVRGAPSFSFGRQYLWQNDALFGYARLLAIKGDKEMVSKISQIIVGSSTRIARFDPYGRRCVDRIYVYRSVPLSNSSVINRSFNPEDIANLLNDIAPKLSNNSLENLKILEKKFDILGASGYRIVAATVFSSQEAKLLSEELNGAITNYLVGYDDKSLFHFVKSGQKYSVQTKDINHIMMNEIMQKRADIGMRGDSFPWRTPNC